MQNTLDPLLEELTRAYVDEHDLSLRLKALFEVPLCMYREGRGGREGGRAREREREGGREGE